ncbi:hypothetical protein I5535_08995 [Rhodobacteraceae bacterium F11138]|nr:hypothetical protein [Rhodobacteraceae bacterium F11138]
MRPLPLALVVSSAVAGVSFAVMWLWTIPIIQDGSNGWPLMDFADAQTPVADMHGYLTSMSPAGRDTYLGAQRVLDTVFPISLAGALGLAIVLSLRARIKRLALVAALVPLVYLYVDLRENAAIAGLLRAHDPTKEAIELAMIYTQVKFLLLLMAGLILALGLLSRLVEWSLKRI